jgi:hypothetical protein
MTPEKISHIHTEPALSTSQVAQRLGFGVSIDFLKSCGLTPLAEHPMRCYWRESDFPLICQAIATHLHTLRAASLSVGA